MIYKSQRNEFEDGTIIPCSYLYRGWTIERAYVGDDNYRPTGDFNIIDPTGFLVDAYPEFSYCQRVVDNCIAQNKIN
tara:strand:- start:455 stop:685 length:231 start_codon:yes stop_codon:yes gene_type:complete